MYATSNESSTMASYSEKSTAPEQPSVLSNIDSDFCQIEERFAGILDRMESVLEAVLRESSPEVAAKSDSMGAEGTTRLERTMDSHKVSLTYKLNRLGDLLDRVEL